MNLKDRLKTKLAKFLFPQLVGYNKTLDDFQRVVEGEIALARAQQPFVELLNLARQQQSMLVTLGTLIANPPNPGQRLAALGQLARHNIKSHEVLASVEDGIEKAKTGTVFELKE